MMPHIPYRLLVSVVMLYLWSGRIQAQPFRVDHIGVDDGLTQGSVYYMLNDSRGFLWFGTQDGLNRYDGHRFRTYRPNRNVEETIWGNNIFGIVEDPAGNLWIGTNEGLNRYNRRSDNFSSFHYLQDDGKPVPNRTLPFYVDQRELLYLSDQEGLVSFDLRTETKTRLEPSLKPPKEYDLQSSTLRTPAGDIWLHAPKGLIRYNLRERKIYHYFSDQPDNQVGKAQAVFAFHIDTNDIAWLGTNIGLVRLDYRHLRFQVFVPRPNQPSEPVYSIDEDKQGLLWLGTQHSGVLYFNKNTRQFSQINDFTDGDKRLTDFIIKKVYVDDRDIVWANVDPNGIAKIVHEPFLLGGMVKKAYTGDLAYNQQLDGYTVRGMVEEIPGDLVWIGTELGINVLDRRSNRIIRRYLHGAGPGFLPKDRPVKHLYRDPQGRLWVGTTYGVLLFNPARQTFEPYDFPNENKSLVAINYVRNMVSTDANTLITATEDGLYQLDIPTRSWQVLPALHERNIFSLMFLPKTRRLWVGTQLHGVFCFQLPPPGSPPTTPWPVLLRELEGYTVLHMYNDTARQALWLATDRGLATMPWNQKPTQPKQLKLYTDRDGLANSFVYCVLPDTDQNLWLSTNRGLARFDPARERFKNFDLSDGLQGYEFNGNAYLRTKDGELFFGGVNGFNRFRPERYQSSTFKPSVHIYDLKINEEPFRTDTYVGETSAIELPYSDNTLSLEFAAIDYISNGRNQYQYQLEGYDKYWVAAGEKNYVRYANLPPDRYTFKVKAANKDNLWSDQLQTLVITIHSPWWRTPPFLLLMAILLGVLAYVWIRRRENTIREQQAERIRLAYSIQEQVKKDIARDLHDEIGTRLATLKLYISQMSQYLTDNTDTRTIRENMVGLINDTISDVRNLLRKLNPRTLEQYGYVAAMEELLNRINATEEIRAHLTLNEAPDRMPAEVERMLYRITQELISNTLKHANATRIDIRFSATDNRLVLEYRDNGVGFDYQHTRQGLGIGNIESRVAIIGGRITWHNTTDTSPAMGPGHERPGHERPGHERPGHERREPDTGTRVTIDLPWNPQDDQPTHTSITTPSLSG
ncbi:hypothetical protein GCM10023187_48400 [Nibrella viscosa]|uniref:Histidine kinase domain-containing protein n=1 Tax=Nibrella viscosa TaxID=1084524 RepID=A0ABP8KU35_9BACT